MQAIQNQHAMRSRPTYPNPGPAGRPPHQNPDHPRRISSPFTLSGLAVCAKCGSLYSGKTTKAKNGRWSYYRCTGKRRTPNPCDTPPIAKRVLEDAVLHTLNQYILLPGTIQALRSIDADLRQKYLGKYQNQIQQITHELSEIRRKITNLTSAIAEHGSSRSLLGQLTELEVQETELTAKLAEYKRITQPPTPISEEQIEEFSKNIRERLKTAEPFIARRILRGFIKSVEVERHGNYIHGQINYYTPSLMPIGSHGGPLDWCKGRSRLLV